MLNVDTKNPSSVTAMAAATKSNVVEHVVEGGQTAVFTVLLKSPEKEGRAISYWRLKTPDAVPFGHKLWVDVTVTAAAAAAAADVVSEKASEAVEAVDKAEQSVKGAEEEKSEASSAMIFPKLDKESPVSSVHGLVAPVTAAEGKAKVDEDDLVEELESLGFEDEEETDDEFLTDEEYDILDASDEDFLVDAQKAVPK